MSTTADTQLRLALRDLLEIEDDVRSNENARRVLAEDATTEGGAA